MTDSELESSNLSRTPGSSQSNAAIPTLVVSALDYCNSVRSGKALVCLPFTLSVQLAQQVLAHPQVAALLMSEPAPELMAEFPGRIEPYAPPSKPTRGVYKGVDHVVFCGFADELFYGVLTTGVRAGVHRVGLLTPAGWKQRSMLGQILKRQRNRIVLRIQRKIIQTLDIAGRFVRPARLFAQRLNADGAIDKFLKAAPAASVDAQPAGVAFYTGSLGAGGAERQMVNTILGLQARGVGPIRVACAMDAEGFYRPILAAAGIPVDLVRADTPQSAQVVGESAVEAVRQTSLLPPELSNDVLCLAKWLEQSPPRVLHCWQDHTNIIGALAGLYAGVPKIVLSTRSLAPYNFALFQANQRPGYLTAGNHREVRFLNNSEAGARDYAAWLGWPASRFNVIRNGINLERLVPPEDAQIEAFRNKLGIPEDAPVLGGVFTFYNIKRPLLWVDAAAQVAKTHPEAHFLIAGDGPMRAQMQKRIAAHNLTDRFHLPGRFENVALPLAAMQAFMLTSSIEGLPNVLLEAQLLGVPVVTAAVGGAPEAVGDGRTGVVVHDPTPENLARAVNDILVDPVWKHCSTLGPAFVKNQFSLDQMMRETLAIYDLS